MASEFATRSHTALEVPADNYSPVKTPPPTNPKLCNIADPTPLGLFSFALSIFVISSYNAGAFGVAATDPVNVFVPIAVYYGGIAQAVAGVLSFFRGDIFGATAFTSYGAFWIAFASLFVPGFGVSQGYSGVHADVLVHAQATFLLGWTIFTFIILVASARTSVALVVLFGLVACTLSLLTAAAFAQNVALHRAGGIVGIITAVLAWYCALAVLQLSMPKPLFKLPLGA